MQLKPMPEGHMLIPDELTLSVVMKTARPFKSHKLGNLTMRSLEMLPGSSLHLVLLEKLLKSLALLLTILILWKRTYDDDDYFLLLLFSPVTDSFAECLSDEDPDVRAAAASTLERLDVLLDDQDVEQYTPNYKNTW